MKRLIQMNFCVVFLYNSSAQTEKKSLDKEPCGGIPFFLNKKTGKTICGEVSYKELKEWAEGC